MTPPLLFLFLVYQRACRLGADFLGRYHYLSICRFHFQHCVESLKALLHGKRIAAKQKDYAD